MRKKEENQSVINSFFENPSEENTVAFLVFIDALSADIAKWSKDREETGKETGADDRLGKAQEILQSYDFSLTGDPQTIQQLDSVLSNLAISAADDLNAHIMQATLTAQAKTKKLQEENANAKPPRPEDSLDKALIEKLNGRMRILDILSQKVASEEVSTAIAQRAEAKITASQLKTASYIVFALSSAMAALSVKTDAKRTGIGCFVVGLAGSLGCQYIAHTVDKKTPEAPSLFSQAQSAQTSSAQREESDQDPNQAVKQDRP